jgi:hypothetical protein
MNCKKYPSTRLFLTPVELDNIDILCADILDGHKITRAEVVDIVEEIKLKKTIENFNPVEK